MHIEFDTDCDGRLNLREVWPFQRQMMALMEEAFENMVFEEPGEASEEEEDSS